MAVATVIWTGLKVAEEYEREYYIASHERAQSPACEDIGRNPAFLAEAIFAASTFPYLRSRARILSKDLVDYT